MSLLVQWLIQAIKKSSERVGRRGYICWVNGSKYRPRRSRRLLKTIINAPEGVSRNQTGLIGNTLIPPVCCYSLCLHDHQGLVCEGKFTHITTSEIHQVTVKIKSFPFINKRLQVVIFMSDILSTFSHIIVALWGKINGCY